MRSQTKLSIYHCLTIAALACAWLSVSGRPLRAAEDAPPPAKAPATTLRSFLAAPRKADPAAKEAKEKKAEGEDKAGKDEKAAKANQPVAARAKVPLARIAAVRVQNGNEEEQIRRQLEPMLKVELSFAIRAAQLNDDERRQMITSCKKWLDEFLPEYIKNLDPNQKNMLMQGAQMVVFGNAPDANQRQKNARDVVQAGVAEVAAKVLAADKLKAYTDESQSRADFEREVLVENRIAIIDERVLLSPKQRKDIAASLFEQWKDDDKPQLEALSMYGSRYPTGPGNVKPSDLTEAQRAVLDDGRRMSGTVFISGGVIGRDGEIIDDVDLEEGAPKDSKKDDDAKKSEPAPTDAKAG